MITFNESEVKEIIDNCFSGVPYAKNIVTDVKITKAEAKNGVTKEIVVSRSNLQNDFNFCKEKEIVTIPKNTRNNAIIEIKEKGNQYAVDETRGNLYVKVHIVGAK